MWDVGEPQNLGGNPDQETEDGNKLDSQKEAGFQNVSGEETQPPPVTLSSDPIPWGYSTVDQKE